LTIEHALKGRHVLGDEGQVDIFALVWLADHANRENEFDHGKRSKVPYEVRLRWTDWYQGALPRSDFLISAYLSRKAVYASDEVFG
jgi:hypothetical protein